MSTLSLRLLLVAYFVQDFHSWKSRSPYTAVRRTPPPRHHQSSCHNILTKMPSWHEYRVPGMQQCRVVPVLQNRTGSIIPRPLRRWRRRPRPASSFPTHKIDGNLMLSLLIYQVVPSTNILLRGSTSVPGRVALCLLVLCVLRIP